VHNHTCKTNGNPELVTQNTLDSLQTRVLKMNGNPELFMTNCAVGEKMEVEKTVEYR